MYLLTLLESTCNTLHKYVWTFPMDVDMDILATKLSSRYDGSVNLILDQQTFNMKNIYPHPDMVLFYSQ